MLDVKPLLPEIETALRADGVSVDAVLREAGTPASTWFRWKSGRPAKPDTWNRVRNAIGAVAPDVAGRVNMKPARAPISSAAR